MFRICCIALHSLMERVRFILLQLLFCLFCVCYSSKTGNSTCNPQFSVFTHVGQSLSILPLNEGFSFAKGGCTTQQETPVKIYKPIRPKARQSDWALLSPSYFEISTSVHHCMKQYSLFYQQCVVPSVFTGDQLRGPPFAIC